ncbi:uncharacterized protein SCHCODRAFT_02584651 [Schizophyllum commune H4-8]|uniref:Uncharacterized protein n=1 Tax=Schizophyllum commune (strain H4-8 / FGSC 9210) TaxID=578458 RepID=D8QAW8_SCHCM|nr:uncharacterized protein SCHCODRAFT_02584651 [Schizophyllum commune H4-8]KAI5888945.1 hypothetical protein SCHCODRAFT_02584651 [Schizophyllum commune H4-8]
MHASPTLVLAASALLHAGVALADDVTLYTVHTEELNPSIVSEYSATVSAVGTASDSAATTYVEEIAISKLEYVFTDKDQTMTIVSEPKTETRTFVEGASTFFMSEPAYATSTTWAGHIAKFTNPSLQEECSYDQDDGKGSCVVVVGPEGNLPSGATTSFAGALQPYQTIEANGAAGSRWWGWTSESTLIGSLMFVLTCI